MVKKKVKKKYSASVTKNFTSLALSVTEREGFRIIGIR